MDPFVALWQERPLIAVHRGAMKGLFFGACVTAGVFTLVPGRFLGDLVWKQWLGVLA